MARFYTVQYVHSDEATPRDIYTKSVKAVDEDDAQRTVWTWAFLDGTRIETCGVMTTSH